MSRGSRQGFASVCARLGRASSGSQKDLSRGDRAALWREKRSLPPGPASPLTQVGTRQTMWTQAADVVAEITGVRRTWASMAPGGGIDPTPYGWQRPGLKASYSAWSADASPVGAGGSSPSFSSGRGALQSKDRESRSRARREDPGAAPHPGAKLQEIEMQGASATPAWQVLPSGCHTALSKGGRFGGVLSWADIGAQVDFWMLRHACRGRCCMPVIVSLPSKVLLLGGVLRQWRVCTCVHDACCRERNSAMQ